MRTRNEFKRVQKEGKRLYTSLLVFQYTSENFSCPRIGISVSKKFGSAVTRNRFKRRVRETFRRLKHTLPAGIKIHISPRTGSSLPTLQQVEAEFAFLLKTLTPC